MTFDWVQNLNLAMAMAGKGVAYTTEAALRCAASRSYFAAYCFARNYAKDRLGFKPDEMSYKDHERVRKHYAAMRQREIANSLNDLREWRNDCDYQDELGDLNLLANQAIESAQFVISTIVGWNSPASGNLP